MSDVCGSSQPSEHARSLKVASRRDERTLTDEGCKMLVGDEAAEGYVMTACLSLDRAIAVEGELKERSEVSRQQSAELRFLWPDVPDSLC